eukprot:COSAG02_NODE_66305_length_255_cov_7.352564_1_plen_60_part_00
MQGGNEVMLRRIVELVEEIDRLQARVEGRDHLPARGIHGTQPKVISNFIYNLYVELTTT